MIDFSSSLLGRYAKYLLLLCCLGSVHLAHAKKARAAKPRTVVERYQAAVEAYHKGDYRNAAEVLDELLPCLRTQAHGITALYYRACCAYALTDYEEAAPIFEQFYSLYPTSVYAEEACYKYAYSLYRSAPPLKIDTSRVERALEALTAYQSKFPKGKYAQAIGAAKVQLEEQLGKQALYVATTYCGIGQYKAALYVLQDFETVFPNNPVQPAVAYQRACIAYRQFKAAGKQSAFGEPLLAYCDEFLTTYGTASQWKKQAKKLRKYQQSALASLAK